MLMVEMLARMPDLRRRIQAEHLADSAGYCRDCHGAPWPCELYRLAIEVDRRYGPSRSTLPWGTPAGRAGLPAGRPGPGTPDRRQPGPRPGGSVPRTTVRGTTEPRITGSNPLGVVPSGSGSSWAVPPSTPAPRSRPAGPVPLDPPGTVPPPAAGSTRPARPAGHIPEPARSERSGPPARLAPVRSAPPARLAPLPSPPPVAPGFGGDPAVTALPPLAGTDEPWTRRERHRARREELRARRGQLPPVRDGGRHTLLPAPAHPPTTSHPPAAQPRPTSELIDVLEDVLRWSRP